MLHLKKRDSYKQENYLERILKDKENLSKLKNSFSDSENKGEKIIGSTILNISEYFPFIYEISKKENFEMSSLLSIISNEPSGYPYIVGITGDFNLFQINPSTIPLIYFKMKSSPDSLFSSYVKDKNLKEFEKKVKMDPKTNIISGVYLMKLLREKSENESKTILLYHLGQTKYNKLPFSIRKKS